ncbi:cysteine desulfurase family protein [Kordiimonas sp. SCSIO 12610]|uniref:cysteine desulfurase family protein n=1 Tax=Kordiimonas sp. SCSIO 12610 TaxID=2829597 RepID=UPI0021093D08|nr:cysteine desulfurase family protein [Kordiimonas sp. SCSIO 12610]UTW53858.1 cysteine desulfurase [Kordiimonas sp. SCSIO 12610]
MAKPIYLDFNATSPILLEVIEKVAETMTFLGNPSSVHQTGRKARSIVEEARSQVAALVGARSRDIVFTSGGTEANNAVLRATGAKSLIISAIEHDCVIAASQVSGLHVQTLSVNNDGKVDLEELSRLLEKTENPALVSVMLGNNEMGVIQDIAKVSTIAKEFGARVHCDAVQAAGKISIDFNELGVDYLTLSAHKLGGPQGVGAIVLAPTAPLNAFIVGGGQELGRRSGTENVAGVAGFGVAAIAALSNQAEYDRVQSLRDRMEAEIRAHANDIIIAGKDTDRLPNTSCIVMPGMKGETQVMHFDLNGICVSSGSACSSGKVKVSHVMTAMGLDEELANSSLRVSLGLSTTDEEIDRFIEAWKTLYNRTKR